IGAPRAAAGRSDVDDIRVCWIDGDGRNKTVYRRAALRDRARTDGSPHRSRQAHGCPLIYSRVGLFLRAGFGGSPISRLGLMLVGGRAHIGRRADLRSRQLFPLLQRVPVGVWRPLRSASHAALENFLVDLVLPALPAFRPVPRALLVGLPGLLAWRLAAPRRLTCQSRPPRLPQLARGSAS